LGALFSLRIGEVTQLHSATHERLRFHLLDETEEGTFRRYQDRVDDLLLILAVVDILELGNRSKSPGSGGFAGDSCGGMGEWLGLRSGLSA
jgi:hypothetical protein